MKSNSRSHDVQSRARLAGYDPSVMESACVLVVGAGALGQNVLQDLALSGVGELRVVDGDTFEDHNRSRSPAHPRRGDYELGVEIPKAPAVARTIADLHVNDRARILYSAAWIEDLGLGAFDGVDVLVVSADALSARERLARVAMQLNIPTVDGGFAGPNLGLTVYPSTDDPHTAACWSCGGSARPGAFSCLAYARHAEADGIVPAIQNGAATLAGLCSEATVNLLHDREPTARRVALNLRTGESRVSVPTADPICAETHRHLPVPVPTAIPPETTVSDALRSIGGSDTAVFLADNFVERANCPGCGVTCEVGAPAPTWERNPRCSSCDGPWPPGAEQIPSPDLIDTGLPRDDPRGELTLATIGFRSGDIVELGGGRYPAIRLAGGISDIYEELSPVRLGSRLAVGG